jgi:hypothetical protein
MSVWQSTGWFLVLTVPCMLIVSYVLYKTIHLLK